MRISSGAGLLGLVFTGLAAFGLAGKAQAAPIININTAASVANYDASSPGNELKLTDDVSNVTGSGSILDALKNYTRPGGTNQGVYSAEAPSDWTYSIGTDTTAFSTIGNVIKDSQIGNFSVFSHSPYVFSSSFSSAFGEAFTGYSNNIDVPMPTVPEPSALVLLAAGAVGLRMRKRE